MPTWAMHLWTWWSLVRRWWVGSGLVHGSPSGNTIWRLGEQVGLDVVSWIWSGYSLFACRFVPAIWEKLSGGKTMRDPCSFHFILIILWLSDYPFLVIPHSLSCHYFLLYLLHFMKTARGMVRPWTKHGRSLMASTDGLCLLQRLGQSLQNLRWPRDGTPDEHVFTRLLKLIYEWIWFSTQVAWKGLWKVAQGLTDLTSARYVKWVGAVHIKAFKPMLSDIATVLLCTRVPWHFLGSQLFFPPPGAKNLRHQDVCYVFGGRLNITCFSASFGRTCCDPEVCQTVTSPWSSRTAFASLSLAQPRKSKLLWHHVGRKRMCNNVIHSGH